MKLFVKILAVLTTLFVIALIGLNIYFNDERLKEMILPKINEAIGREIAIEEMSITFFRTFPQFGLSMKNFELPGNAHEEPVAKVGEFLAAVKIFPLISGEIAISELRLIRPELNYLIAENGTSNIDFLTALSSEEAPVSAPEASSLSISIPELVIEQARINYMDTRKNNNILLQNFTANISLDYGKTIKSTVDATLESISVAIGGTEYINRLSLSLTQASELDLDAEILTISEGTLSIRGLALNLSGDVKNWTGEALGLNLEFASQSDNFGDLLRLAPPEFDEQLKGLETRGALSLKGNVKGEIKENTIPDFNILVSVKDGYVKNPDLPEAIRDIAFTLNANNANATVEGLQLKAGQNAVTGSANIDRPLDADAVVSVDLKGNADLSTVNSFYDIKEFGVEQLKGLLAFDVKGNGKMDAFEKATFSANLNLTNGYLKYTDVPKPVEDIQAQIVAGQDLLRISRLSLKAANNNTLSVEGSVQKPLDEKARSLDITTKMNLDLATIKDFYPIDEDTLSMRGKLIADAVLKGKPDPEQIEKLLQRATVELRNGYISHRDLGKPIEDLTFLASASGSRLTIREARFKTGNNSLALTGNVDKYLSEEPILDVQINGDALLSDVSAYYSLEPWINQLNGEITLNLKAKGPAGDPVKLTLTGALELKNVSASGDSLPLPVTNMQGKLTVTPTELSLDRFSMNYGTSDFSLNGKVKNYLGFLEEHSSTSTMPIITGNYYSKKLNLDEMIDWEAETEDVPIPINLPKITGNFSARIDSLIAMEMNITQIQGNGRISPTEILLDQANARMYGGTAKGKMIWNAQNPERTKLTFNGSLDTLKAAEFLGGNALMGDGNQMGNHLTGKLSATVNYFTEFDIFINPDMGSTLADGSFGMADGRLKDHPMQKQLASLLKSPELQDVVLDEWLSTFTIKDTVMTIKNLKLTSKDVGMEINGTQHMVNDKIDYKANLFLPPKFKNTIASVISKQGADALSQKDGTLKVPLAITGTSENPKVAPDAKIVDDILKNFLKNEVGGAVRKLFGGGK